MSLRRYLDEQKQAYLHQQKTEGGTAGGFRQRIRDQFSDDPAPFLKMVLDAVMEATTKKWEEEPRKRGPDLFSLAGYPIPENLTRPAYHDAEGAFTDEPEGYEKLHQEYSTLQDLFDDATIKLRNAARASAVAEEQMKAVDEGRRRARGRMDMFLRDIKD